MYIRTHVLWDKTRQGQDIIGNSGLRACHNRCRVRNSRAVTDFIAEMIKPKIGETVADFCFWKHLLLLYLRDRDIFIQITKSA